MSQPEVHIEQPSRCMGYRLCRRPETWYSMDEWPIEIFIRVVFTYLKKLPKNSVVGKGLMFIVSLTYL